MTNQNSAARRNTMSTEELQALDAAHHLHPFTQTRELNQKGVRVISSAKGVHIEDSDGAKMLDGMAGLWCVNIGYGRDELADAAARQMRELPYYNTFFQTSHPPVIELSKRLADLAPEGLNHVFYAGSGSEANDTNIRAVRQYWANLGKPEKRVIISRKNGYHGSTMGGASLGGMGFMHEQGGLPIPDIHHIDQPYWYAEGGDMSPEDFGLERARALEVAIQEIGAENVAAFIGEPVQGAGGVIIPPSTYWPEIQRICKEYDILLIADEVITAFGRTGNWFACETFDIKPDIITIAKGLTSGYIPMGGSIMSDRVHEGLLDTPGEFAHGYTYSGHPVAAAVALENLRIIEEDKLIENVRSGTGPYLAEKWAGLAEHPLVGEARICGMMGALELTPDKATRAPFKDGGKVGYMCREACFNNGLVMRAVVDKMIISPPLVLQNHDVDEFIEKAWIALDTAVKQAKEAGLL